MSDSKIYVGNLSYNTTEDGLRDFFGHYGKIEDLIIIMDRGTGRSKGFGFVTFDSSDAANNAVAEGNGGDLDGRTLRVNIADSDRKTGGGGGGGNRDRGGDRGRGGYGDR